MKTEGRSEVSMQIAFMALSLILPLLSFHFIRAANIAAAGRQRGAGTLP
jgi:cell division protein FtsB